MNRHNNVNFIFEISDVVRAFRDFGNACSAAAKAIAEHFTQVKSLEELIRAIRTETGPWYRRLYWRAAYSTADRFPEWVSPE